MKPTLAVLVPTFRRPNELIQTLESVAGQDVDEPFIITVADNDAALHEGEVAAKNWAALRGVSERLLTMVAAERGISQCRNTGIYKLISMYPSIAFIAMIDDDARATPQWLRKLTEVQRQSNADLVGGPVVYKFPAEAPDWMQSARLFQTPKRKTGYVDKLRGSGNCLLSTSLLRKVMPKPFDERFGLSGSEDIDFFERCHRLGAKSAWAADAVVFEIVLQNRLSREWILKRMRCIGHSEVMILLKYRPKFYAYVTATILSARGLISGLVRSLVFPSQRIRFSGAINIAQSLGRIDAVLRRENSFYR
jgi:succinoglycan biosynthesis protein ExoM